MCMSVMFVFPEHVSICKKITKVAKMHRSASGDHSEIPGGIGLA